jgi:hypothetical protein
MLAIVAGVVVIIAVTTAIDALLHAAGVFPPLGVEITDTQGLIALSYRIVITIAGAYLTASLAPSAPMRHALILGIVGTVLGTAGAIATLSKHLGPDWYPISIAVLAIPECLVGGKLRALRMRDLAQA